MRVVGAILGQRSRERRGTIRIGRGAAGLNHDLLDASAIGCIEVDGSGWPPS